MADWGWAAPAVTAERPAPRDPDHAAALADLIAGRGFGSWITDRMGRAICRRSLLRRAAARIAAAHRIGHQRLKPTARHAAISDPPTYLGTWPSGRIGFLDAAIVRLRSTAVHGFELPVPRHINLCDRDGSASDSLLEEAVLSEPVLSRHVRGGHEPPTGGRGSQKSLGSTPRTS
jgi:hypothetical protein